MTLTSNSHLGFVSLSAHVDLEDQCKKVILSCCSLWFQLWIRLPPLPPQGGIQVERKQGTAAVFSFHADPESWLLSSLCGNKLLGKVNIKVWREPLLVMVSFVMHKYAHGHDQIKFWITFKQLVSGLQAPSYTIFTALKCSAIYLLIYTFISLVCVVCVRAQREFWCTATSEGQL